MKILSIEGNIGAGKSTLLNVLQQKLKHNADVIFMLEPTDLWEDIKDDDNNTMLQKFYGDQERYAFSFQVMAFATRIKKMREKIKANPHAKVMICERSLDADYHIFAKMLYESKKIEDINYKVYLEFYEIFKDDFPLSGLIYVDASPFNCHNRINMRNRTGESEIPVAYLQQCDDAHRAWLFQNNKKKMLRIQTDVEFENDSDKQYYFKLWTDQMVSFTHQFM